MGKPNFFVSIDALQKILEMPYEGTAKPVMDITLDVIDLPLWFSLKNNKQSQTMSIYKQGELYSKDESLGIPVGSVVLDNKTGSVQGSAHPGIDQQTLAMFYIACRNLSIYAKEKKMQQLWADDDPNQSGILIEVKNDSMEWKKVSGNERPELTVERMFGGTMKMRPYMEDFWDRSATDMMSLEEKIEKGESGDKFAMAKLAQAYLDGEDGVEQDPEKAAYWFRKEADLEDSEGAYNLGLLYAKGFGVERDFVQAAEWMEKAVAWGDPDGEAPAKLYREMADNQRKAEAGDAAAMAEFAGRLMSLDGSLYQAGAEEDYRQSLFWAQKAIDAGCAGGYFVLALAYEHGRGVSKNDKKAVELYRKGADGDDPRCQHSYACRLITGEGVGKDAKKARMLLEKSAGQGYSLAYKALGRIYETGEGVAPDFEKELEYYEKACVAEPNNAELLRHVGFQYTNLMEGLDRWLYGLEKAVEWLRKAADLGDKVATTGAERMERILAMHKEGKIPLGTPMDKCMGYLSGKEPQQKQTKTSSKKQATSEHKDTRNNKEKKEERKEQVEKKEETVNQKQIQAESKKIRDTVKKARDEARKAERAFDDAASDIEEMASSPLDYFGSDFDSRLEEIAEMSVSTCNKLFNAYQNQVRKVDKVCRPLLNENRTHGEIQEIVDVIKWLNKESEIENSFSGTLNGTSMGKLVKNEYYPEKDCISIQHFWEGILKKTPKTQKEIQKEREEKQKKAKEEKERKEKEAELIKKREEARSKAKDAYHLEYDEKQKQRSELESKLHQMEEQIDSLQSIETGPSTGMLVILFGAFSLGLVIIIASYGFAKVFGFLLTFSVVIYMIIKIIKSSKVGHEITSCKQEKKRIEDLISQIGRIPTEEEYIRTHVN